MNDIEQKINYVQFCDTGYIQSKYTDEQLKPIKNRIQEIRKDFVAEKVNSKLAGNIEHEYSLIEYKNYLQNLLLPLCLEYDKIFSYFKTIDCLTESVPFALDDVWVNFQKKHEFNPPHFHSGVLSFVMWIDIPYDMEDEMNLPKSKNSTYPVPGHFQFLYTNGSGTIRTHNIPADKKYNNTVIVFPSKMLHSVYPFYTSDDYRISVSGNFKLDSKKTR